MRSSKDATSPLTSLNRFSWFLSLPETSSPDPLLTQRKGPAFLLDALLERDGWGAASGKGSRKPGITHGAAAGGRGVAVCAPGAPKEPRESRTQ